MVGRDQPRGEPDFKFTDMRLRDFELAGVPIFNSFMSRFANEELAFTDEADVRREGEALGVQIMGMLSIIRQERRALLDNGQLSDDAFEEYALKAFRHDLPHNIRASETRTRKKQGPQ